MRFLLVYKGEYGEALRGPEMRYVQLAKSLHKDGNKVVILAKQFNKTIFNEFVRFQSLSNPFLVLSAFYRSDCIVMHGGGPVLLLLSIIMGCLGKKIVLDSYVPHWVELDEKISHSKGSIKLGVKSAFNAFRVLVSVLCFDYMIVANKRQQDLVRGFSAPFFRTTEFKRIHIIPFGCEPYKERSKQQGVRLLNSFLQNNQKLSESDFLVGWLGGTYGWFDLKEVLANIADALANNPAIKLVFFGVSEKVKSEILTYVNPKQQNNLVFIPWVPFAERFDYWAAFDISLVWGGDGYENDYASRTRNFDCMSLGLPIIQNEDDEWGVRLSESGAGVVARLDNVAEQLLALSQNKLAVQKMRSRMIGLAPEFFWESFSAKLSKICHNPSLSILRRIVGVIGLVMIIPVVVLFVTYNLSASSVKSKFS